MASKNLLESIESVRTELELLSTLPASEAKAKLVSEKESELQELESEFEKNKRYHLLAPIQKAIDESNFAKRLVDLLSKHDNPECKIVFFNTESGLLCMVKPLTFRSLKSTTLTRNAFALPEVMRANVFDARNTVAAFTRTDDIPKGKKFESYGEAFQAIIGCYGKLSEKYSEFLATEKGSKRYSIAAPELLKTLTRGEYDIRTFFKAHKTNLEVVSENFEG